MTDYAKLSDGEMVELCGDNAQSWAEAFVQICKNPRDVHEVAGWFANAIEVSHDKRSGGLVVLPDGSAFFANEIN